MKEALIHLGPKVEIVDSPIPEPGMEVLFAEVSLH